jgi:uncharacterized membrane protein
MKLENVKKGWVTTIIGSLFLMASLAMLVLSIIKWEFDTAIIAFLTTITFVGVALLFSPDAILNKFKNSTKL